MFTFLIASLTVTIAVAVVVVLADCAVRAVNAHRAIASEIRALRNARSNVISIGEASSKLARTECRFPALTQQLRAAA